MVAFMCLLCGHSHNIPRFRPLTFPIPIPIPPHAHLKYSTAPFREIGNTFNIPTHSFWGLRTLACSSCSCQQEEQEEGRLAGVPLRSSSLYILVTLLPPLCCLSTLYCRKESCRVSNECGSYRMIVQALCWLLYYKLCVPPTRWGCFVG